MENEMKFEEVVTEHSRRLFNMVYGMVGQYDDASDITQDALCLAYKAFPKFRGESGVYTWLYTIAKNECRKHFNKKKRWGFLSLQDEILPPPPGNDCDIDSKLSVRKAIAALPFDFREPIVLKYFDRMSYQEIADTMRTPVGTVRSRLARAREMLQKTLQIR
jgi:RNA polymerase sigma-70 factor (ECF subfamily)